jgi:hypothetical protein
MVQPFWLLLRDMNHMLQLTMSSVFILTFLFPTKEVSHTMKAICSAFHCHLYSIAFNVSFSFDQLFYLNRHPLELRKVQFLIK